MFTVNRGRVEVHGRTDILLAELSGLIFAFRQKNVASDEMIRSAVEKGFLSKEEIHSRAGEIIKKMSSTELLESLKDYIENAGGKKDDI